MMSNSRLTVPVLDVLTNLNLTTSLLAEVRGVGDLYLLIADIYFCREILHLFAEIWFEVGFLVPLAFSESSCLSTCH